MFLTTEQATTVMQQLLRAIEESKKADEKQGPTVASVPASNEADQSDHSVVEELTQQMEGTTISSTGSSRRSSYLHRQPQSISGTSQCVCGGRSL